MEFEEAMLAYLESTVKMDRSMICAIGLKFEFKSATVRLWGGKGNLYTPDGEVWTGWVGKNDQAFISVPKTIDVRTGDSPTKTIELGYLTKELYEKLREDEEEEVTNRDLTIYKIYLEHGSTRTIIPPGDPQTFKMTGRSFREKRSILKTGQISEQYTASVNYKNVNAGRSKTFSGSMSSAGQKARSSILYGDDNDEYGSQIARYANGVTLKI